MTVELSDSNFEECFDLGLVFPSTGSINLSFHKMNYEKFRGIKDYSTLAKYLTRYVYTFLEYLKQHASDDGSIIVYTRNGVSTRVQVAKLEKNKRGVFKQISRLHEEGANRITDVMDSDEIKRFFFPLG